MRTPSSRNLAVLVTSQALFVTGTSVLVATSALVGAQLAPDPRLATVPTGLGFLVAMLVTYPASLLMQAVGRKQGFWLGQACSGVGAGLAASAILYSSFPLFCLALVFIGANRGIAPYYRFAAVESVDESHKARAIAWILVGGLIAAFLGPNLARWTRDLVAGGAFAGTFLALAAIQIVAIFVMSGLDLPTPPKKKRSEGGRALARIACQPLYAVAVFVAIVSFVMMNALMTATPLAMADRGFVFGHTASVIQWHAVGMFAPALFSGRLVDRFGTIRMMFAGTVLLASSASINLIGESLGHFILSLATLGIGWNFLFIAATTLLTDTYRPEEKARAQGLNDFLVFAAVTVSATSSAWLYESLGWRGMSWAALPLVALVGVAVALASRPMATTPESVEPSAL